MGLENVIGRSTKIWLGIFGMWPDSSYIWLRRVFWVIMLVIEQICHYQYIIIHYYSFDLSKIMNVMGETMPFTLLLIKLGIFWSKQRVFGKILTMMTIDWEKCSDTEFSMLVVTYKAKLSQQIANSTTALYTIAVLLYCSEILVHRTDDEEIFNITAQPLILKMNVPFDLNRRFIYELVIVVQFIHLLSSSCVIGTINSLLINLVLHLGGQINILRELLVNIYTLDGERGLRLIMIRNVIEKHKRIIVFSKHIEDLYSYIALVLFVSDTLIICSLGFVIVTSVGAPDATIILLKIVVFYFVMNLEAFTFCFAGEYMNAKSKTIGDAAYNSRWYESNSEDGRVVLLLIMRSQNQLTLTIGKVMDLSLERFSSIVKASASYVSVLLAMY